MAEEPTCNTKEELINEAKEMKEWFENELKIQWNPITYNNPDVKLYDLPMRGYSHRTRCRVHCNCTFEQMLKFNQETNIDELKKYDKSLLNYEIFDQVEGTNILVTHTAFSVTWPVTARQFVSLHDNYPTENGHIFIQTSIKNDKVKTNKKYVTAYKKSALLIEKDPEDPKRCYIERIIEMDPRGSIPTFVVASNKTNDAERMWEMKLFVEEKVKKGEL
ncbi:hypothetical protein, conserved [Entamoeba dispar SAW760]|uniref:START domain-containing protein n=1 Tax=Entamoeba dispar (strain ATCC PRA-260 / SAW760) TaxID=370354 RepID=B0EUK5_ENTDS|nr:uncharacterized protein EDI_334500 [Entamoeba dispar SAW760]EDR21781.1 hypothetical protein, conserved [Entamoeba dispar SAW760]|eukprot:EDR21781.1 hypothetical protein, conserved [Entamoeba dispar SAW760]